MKRVLLIAVALVGIVSAMFAQESAGQNIHFRKGYTADVRLTSTNVNMFHIISSHGYGLGHGLYVGAGAGFGAEWMAEKVEGTPHYVPSLFVNARWSMLNAKVSPFVDLVATQYIDLAEGKANYGLTPTVGLDLGRFSLGVGYAIRDEKSAMQVGVGFTF